MKTFTKTSRAFLIFLICTVSSAIWRDNKRTLGLRRNLTTKRSQENHVLSNCSNTSVKNSAKFIYCKLNCSKKKKVTTKKAWWSSINWMNTWNLGDTSMKKNNRYCMVFRLHRINSWFEWMIQAVLVFLLTVNQMKVSKCNYGWVWDRLE